MNWGPRLPTLDGMSYATWLDRRPLALLTASMHHVWFSQNARGYTGLAFFSTLGANAEFYAPYADNARRFYALAQDRVLYMNHAVVDPPVERQDSVTGQAQKVAHKGARPTDRDGDGDRHLGEGACIGGHHVAHLASSSCSA